MICRKLTHVVVVNCALGLVIGLCSSFGFSQSDDYPDEPAATPVPAPTKTPRNSGRKFLDSLIDAGIDRAKKAATKSRRTDSTAATPYSSPDARDTYGGATPTPYPADAGSGGYPTSKGGPDPASGRPESSAPSDTSGRTTNEALPPGKPGENAEGTEANTNGAITAAIEEPAPPGGPPAANWPLPLGIGLLVAILGGGAFFFLRRKPKPLQADISFRLKRDTKSKQEIKDTDSLTADYAFTLRFNSDRGIQTLEEETGSA